MATRYRWCVEERGTGSQCASGSAPTQDDAAREMIRYALQYGQDGPVRYWMKLGNKTLILGSMSGVKVEGAAAAMASE